MEATLTTVPRTDGDGGGRGCGNGSGWGGGHGDRGILHQQTNPPQTARNDKHYVVSVGKTNNGEVEARSVLAAPCYLKATEVVTGLLYLESVLWLT